MKERILICASIALCGTIIKFICRATGKNKNADVITVIVSVFILLGLFPIVGQTFSLPSLSGDDTDNFEEISNEAMSEIHSSVEKQIENLLLEEVSSKFDIVPIECDISINEDNLTLEKAKMLLSSERGLISGYEIKNFLREKYDIDVEVIII